MSEVKTFLMSLSDTAQALIEQVNNYQGEISNIKIENPDQRTNAVELGKKLNGLTKDLDSERMNQTRPIDVAKKQIMDLYQPITATCTNMVNALKQAILTFDREEQRKIREAQEKARIEAEEATRKERERLAKLAEKQIDRGAVEKAEATIEKIEQVQAFIPVIASAVEKVKGESTRKVWKFEITDEKQIPREYLSVDEVKIRKVVQALKDDTNIAGVRVYQEESLTLGR
jgi:tyrosyl-tRNA synthetase